MIADGIVEEIAGLCAVGELDDLLRAAHVGQGKARHQATFGDEMPFQVTGNFEHGDGAFLHKTSDAST